jgi:hypothetical protein
MITRHDLRGKLAPAWAQEVLERFGRNPYGEPNFRVIWRPSRVMLIGGYWQDNGKHEYRVRRKYGLDPKWCLERWRPAGIYGTPFSWEMNHTTADGFFAIGPFPAHGEYESCEVFSTGVGLAGYVPLEPGLITLTAQAVLMGRIRSYSDIRIALRDEEIRKEQKQDEEFDEMWKERQLTRSGATMGAGGFFNKQNEIDNYVRKLERRKLFVPKSEFTPGFQQH